MLIDSGLKPRIKIEFVHILEPEISRRIAGMVIDATPAVIGPETEPMNEQQEEDEETEDDSSINH